MKRPLISHLHEHVKKVSFFLFVSFENINTILLGEPSKKKYFSSKQQVVIRHLTFHFDERVKNPQNRVKPCISKNFGPTSKPCPIEVRVL